MRQVIIFILMFSFATAEARDLFGNGDPKRDSLRRYRNTVDTNYIRKYPDRFIVTLSECLRAYDIRMRQTMFTDTTGMGEPQLVSNLKWSTGIALDFDKISISFGIGSQPYTNTELLTRGKTSYSALSCSFSFYRFRLETSYRKYKGFYDMKLPGYDTIMDSVAVYYQDPDLMARSIRVKAIFVKNKRKFSYNAAYFNTQRQLKSAGSLLLVSNIYDNVYSTTKSIVPDSAQQFYGPYAKMNYVHMQGLSIGPGYSLNIVLFKTLFLNLTLTSGFDFQHRRYLTSDNSSSANYWKIGAAGDFRAAMGLNGKNMFLSLTYRVDYNSYVMQGMTLETRYHAVDLNWGYRFKLRRGRIYKKLNENKWYQLI